jgi:hypothetical protein
MAPFHSANRVGLRHSQPTVKQFIGYTKRVIEVHHRMWVRKEENKKDRSGDRQQLEA